jgi:hypothetical protein
VLQNREPGLFNQTFRRLATGFTAKQAAAFLNVPARPGSALAALGHRDAGFAKEFCTFYAGC